MKKTNERTKTGEKECVSPPKETRKEESARKRCCCCGSETWQLCWLCGGDDHVFGEQGATKTNKTTKTIEKQCCSPQKERNKQKDAKKKYKQTC